jgi:ubiquinone/menaquinone biosynthesis C-methylase UbiE
MDIVNKNIDCGKAFDWGRVSKIYAKFRDIYPDEFYKKIIERNLCVKNQRVLDLGTGTGVLPRNLYKYGAQFVGTDISENQILMAKELAKKSDMDIEFLVASAEDIKFPEKTFDVITACQCFWYFDHQKIMPNLSKILKDDGRLVILYMAWLPFEDEIAGACEDLILKYSPNWSGAGETKKPIDIPSSVYDYFEMEYSSEFDLKVPFTRESWNGRLKACRGVGASLSADEIASWEKENLALLNKIAPPQFEISHYGAMAVLKKKSRN